MNTETFHKANNILCQISKLQGDLQCLKDLESRASFEKDKDTVPEIFKRIKKVVITYRDKDNIIYSKEFDASESYAMIMILTKQKEEEIKKLQEEFDNL